MGRTVRSTEPWFTTVGKDVTCRLCEVRSKPEVRFCAPKFIVASLYLKNDSTSHLTHIAIIAQSLVKNLVAIVLQQPELTN